MEGKDFMMIFSKLLMKEDKVNFSNSLDNMVSLACDV